MSKERLLSIYEIYAKGKENLKKRDIEWEAPPNNIIGASVKANRSYLNSLFFETKFLDPAAVDTSFTIFGMKLKAPIFCSPISKGIFLSDNDLTEIAKGVSIAGILMMLGIGNSDQLQGAIDTGAPVVKMVKPYRNTDLIYRKVHDAEKRGCVAVGMDIDHFYGVLRDGIRIERTELFGPQKTEDLKQVISEAKLPFIIKGVLSVSDAEKAAELGASSIIVSNHGRGAIDFSVPSMIALPHIAEAVGREVIVLVDTGFKTGSDALKALAFGAKAVGFASSLLLALAAGGSATIELLINQIIVELSRTMAATGCANLSAIKKSIIRQMPPNYNSWI